ncbi:MAG: hypothetical protein NC310_02040 [Roseburia sp.]|nr:hypothetical protein [Roseburia sp.]MCM1556306.1 hypothetical protein [Anaeroplasma bactoclasticum]
MVDKTRYSKYGEILTLIMISFLIDKKLEPVSFCLTYSISRRRLKDYIAVIRNSLEDNHVFYITIEFKRSLGLYVCYVNS